MRLLFTLLFVFNLYAVEVGYSPISIHNFDRSEYFKNKVDKKGIAMTNPIFYTIIDSNMLFVGKDSLNSNIIGYLRVFSNNIVLGFYKFDRERWKNWDNVNTKLGFVPVVGYRYKKYFNLDGNKINFNIIFTPLVTSVGVGFNF